MRSGSVLLPCGIITIKYAKGYLVQEYEFNEFLK
jgi:hypothetical protein